MSKRWQKVELVYLKKHAGKKSLRDLAQRFHTDEATVKAKLEELEAGGKQEPASTDVVDHYQEGMQALYAGEWAKAIERFAEVEKDAYGEVAARARQMVAIARQRMAEAPPEDPWLLAVFEKNRGRFAEAMKLCSDAGRCEEDGRFAYLAAVLHTVQGDLVAGRRHLDRAIELDPHNRAHALHDPDLRPLRGEAGGQPNG